MTIKIEIGKKYICVSRPDISYIAIQSFNLPSRLFDCLVVYTNGNSWYGKELYDEYGIINKQYPGAKAEELIAEWVDPCARYYFPSWAELKSDETRETCSHEKIVNASFMHIRMACAKCGKLEEEIKAERNLRTWGL